VMAGVAGATAPSGGGACGVVVAAAPGWGAGAEGGTGISH
jgi:hypothetical protein